MAESQSLFPNQHQESLVFAMLLSPFPSNIMHILTVRSLSPLFLSLDSTANSRKFYKEFTLLKYFQSKKYGMMTYDELIYSISFIKIHAEI